MRPRRIGLNGGSCQGGDQDTQFEIVEMATEVRLGRIFVDKLIADHNGGKGDRLRRLDGEVPDNRDSFARSRPLHAALRWLRLLRGVPDRPGGEGIRVTRIFAGTNEIMKTIAARFMGL